MGNQYPWRDKETVRELYCEKGLTTYEVAERLGCTQPTISEWLGKHGIRAKYTEKEHGSLRTTERGYVYFNGKNEQVWIHHLLAIAEGHDPEKVFGDGFNVHHKSGVGWDNRVGNVELLSTGEHTRKHYEGLKKAQQKGDSRIGKEQCEYIREEWEPNSNVNELAEELGFTTGAIWYHAVGKCSH